MCLPTCCEVGFSFNYETCECGSTEKICGLDANNNVDELQIVCNFFFVMGGTNSELFGELESCIALLKMYFGDITRVNTCAGLGASLQEPRNLVLNLELCICEVGN